MKKLMIEEINATYRATIAGVAQTYNGEVLFKKNKAGVYTLVFTDMANKEFVMKRYYTNGDLAFIKHYKGHVYDYLQHGLYLGYYQNNVLRIRCNFIEGKLHGEYRRWFEDGCIEAFADYNHGVRDGECFRVEYNKYTHALYSKGKRVGLEEHYNTKGKLLAIISNNIHFSFNKDGALDFVFLRGCFKGVLKHERVG